MAATVSSNDYGQLPGEARRDLYAYLASLFLAPPPDAAIDLLAGEDSVGEVVSTLAGTEGHQALQAWRSRHADNEQVRQSFAELFRIPGTSYTAPFESVVLAEENHEPGSLAEAWRDGMNRLMHFYLEQGRAEATRRVAADYIGVELDFMRFLCQRELEAADSELTELHRLQRQFLENHLGRWLGLLQQRIDAKDSLGFYRLAGLLACGLVEAHRRQLAANTN